MDGRQRGLAFICNVIIHLQRAVAVIGGNPAVVNVALDQREPIAVYYQRTGSHIHRADRTSFLSHQKVVGGNNSTIQIHVTYGCRVPCNLEDICECNSSTNHIEGAQTFVPQVEATAKHLKSSTVHCQLTGFFTTSISKMYSSSHDDFVRDNSWARDHEDSDVSVGSGGNVTGGPVFWRAPEVVASAIVPLHVSLNITHQSQHQNKRNQTNHFSKHTKHNTSPNKS
ncbi:hypothetical protein ES703_92761 [subsurface metagenome]